VPLPETGTPPGVANLGAAPTIARPRKGLMIAGWATLGGSYLFSVLVAAMLYEKDVNPGAGKVCLNCRAEGDALLIPLVGPFMAIPKADGADGKAVVAIIGVVQLAGLAMGIVGTVLYATRLKAYKASQHRFSGIPLTESLTLQAGVAPGPRTSANVGLVYEF
jgi:hypothetical protein